MSFLPGQMIFVPGQVRGKFACASKIPKYQGENVWLKWKQSASWMVWEYTIWGISLSNMNMRQNVVCVFAAFVGMLKIYS